MSNRAGFNPIHISDVESCLNECSDGLGQLGALLAAICEKSPEGSTLAKLATLGCNLAVEMENHADATREHLHKGGVMREGAAP